MDDETRAAFLPGAVLGDWVPERLFVEFIDSLWKIASVGKSDASFLRWIDIVTDRGFGEARELFTSLASPVFLLRRAQELWRFEHSTGTLTYARLSTESARLTLRDHPFLETEATRTGIAEAFRHIIHLTGAHDVTETHEVSPEGHLHVVIAWTEGAPGAGADPDAS
ncbi:MAG: hypothetical protein ABI461_20925 [Polyangiaceae bacterium]